MEKQERRRKIMSRGTDRMALITGRIQSLDPDPFSKSCSFSTPPQPPPPPQHARSSSVPTTSNEEALFRDARPRGGHNAPETVTRHDNNEAISKETIPKEPIPKEPIPKANDSTAKPPLSQKPQQKQEITITSSNNTNVPTKPFDSLLGSVSPKEINFSIITTEDTRALCSVALAILVILSHINLPPNVGKPKSLITFGPLYLVLLTDLFIVAARLAPYALMKKEENEPKIEEDQDWGGAFKLLEVGLVLHQTIRALFIDCSVYLLIVVCGLSVV